MKQPADVPKQHDEHGATEHAGNCQQKHLVTPPGERHGDLQRSVEDQWIVVDRMDGNQSRDATEKPRGYIGATTMLYLAIPWGVRRHPLSKFSGGIRIAHQNDTVPAQ